QPVFETIVANAARLCDASFGAVHRVDGVDIAPAAAMYNISPEQRALYDRLYPRPARGDTGIEEAVLTRRTVHVEDVRTDPRYHPTAEAVWTVRQIFGYRTALCVPMVQREQT